VTPGIIQARHKFTWGLWRQTELRIQRESVIFSSLYGQDWATDLLSGRIMPYEEYLTRANGDLKPLREIKLVEHMQQWMIYLLVTGNFEREFVRLSQK
jgi:hypothetical protein